MAEHIVVSVQDRILFLRLDRPEKKNALTRGMYLGMIDGHPAGGSRSGRARGPDHRHIGLFYCGK